MSADFPRLTHSPVEFIKRGNSLVLMMTFIVKKCQTNRFAITDVCVVPLSFS